MIELVGCVCRSFTGTQLTLCWASRFTKVVKRKGVSMLTLLLGLARIRGCWVLICLRFSTHLCWGFIQQEPCWPTSANFQRLPPLIPLFSMLTEQCRCSFKVTRITKNQGAIKESYVALIHVNGKTSLVWRTQVPHRRQTCSCKTSSGFRRAYSYSSNHELSY